MKHVFVVTYGRTGSTALLKALNAIDGACIRGQNGGVLADLAEAVETLRDFAAERANDLALAAGNPWVGLGEARPDALARSLAEAFTRDVLAPPPGTRLTGFKEIRYTDEILSDRSFDATIRFMLEAFPDPRIVFLTRDPAQCARSGWWQDRDPEVVVDVLEMTMERFRRAHETHRDHSFMIDHATFDRRPVGLHPLVDWLGETVNQEVLAAALEERLLHLD